MHALLANQIVDIGHFNDKAHYVLKTCPLYLNEVFEEVVKASSQTRNSYLSFSTCVMFS